jgi:hypothetical protein
MRTAHLGGYVEANSRALYDALRRDLTGPLASVAEDQSEAAAALVKSLLKKFGDDSPETADKAAFDKFTSVNERCERFRFGAMQEWEWMIVGEVREYLYRFFHPTSVGSILDWESVFENARPGPGSSIGARGEDFYTKHFDSTLTYTHRARYLVPLYQRCLSGSPSWKSAEILRQSIYGFREVEGSKMSTVPKNADISRTICTEPSLNMFFQLGVGGVMTSRLREWGLDIGSTPVSVPQADLNRRLAREGSIHGTFGTIDLSSASDSLSLEMLRFMLPQDVFLRLWCLRCDSTEIPGKGKTELHMLSTMGNGYTFPLQTVLFTCVVLAVYKCMQITARKSLNGSDDTWAVFGDDIIVRREAYDMVCRILELLGFEVNREKSFNEGPFRESCGTDWYAGVDIRGVYCKSLVSVGARFSLINRLLRWSARHGILLRETIKYLLQTVPVVKVPLLEGDDCGVKVPFADSGYKESKGMLAYVKYAKHGPRLKYDVITDKLLVPPKSKLRRRLVNHYGLVVAMLQGSFCDGTISLRARPGDEKYHRCRAKVHYWDSLTRVSRPTNPGPMVFRLVPEMSPGEWQSWSTTVSTHLDCMRR